MFCGIDRNLLGIDPNLLRERAVEFWKELYRGKAVLNVSAKTGFSISRVEKWFGGSACPNSVVIVIGAALWGPGFLKALYRDDAPEWVNQAYRESERAKREQQILQLRAEQQALR